MDLTKRATQQRIVDTENDFKEKYESAKEQMRADQRLDLSMLKQWMKSRKWKTAEFYFLEKIFRFI